MVTVTMKADYQDMKKGKRYEVTNNIAFGLIDSGVAIKYTPKVMTPSRSKMKYKVK